MNALNATINELGNAWRSVASRPAFSGLVVLVLAAGLGCVLYVAGMMNGLMVRPLPFAAPERLFDAGLIDNDDPLDTDDFDPLEVDDVLGWREHLAPHAEVAVYGQRTINLSDGERPERYSGAITSANLFATLGARPALGRDFHLTDEALGAAPVAILSDSLWRTRYLADPRIVGREIRVNARPTTVVGVMPPDFSFPFREAVWLPATLQRGATGSGELSVLLRLHEGSSEQQARSALGIWYADAQRSNPERMRSRARAVGMQPFAYKYADRETRALFGVMATAVGIVLLIACANATNLLLTQLAGRQQELWMRVALGAGRGRLMLHLLAQTGLLATIALAVALPVAQLLVRATETMFRSAAEDGPPHWMRFGLDANLIALAITVALFTALATAVLPALRVGSFADRGDGARVHSGRGFARISRALVVGEVALSCALLIAAAVLVQAILRLDNFDLGLRTDKVLTARIALFESTYPDDAAVTTYVERVLERVRADPEVEAATISASLPGLMGENIDVLERGAATPTDGIPNIGYSAVDESFLDTMGATLVEGRFFAPADRQNAARLIVVDQTFVARFAPEGDAIGRTFVLDPASPDRREATVIGVIRPVQMDDIDDRSEATLLEPFYRAPARYFSLLVRTRGESNAHADQLLRAVSEIDADTPAYWVRGYDAVLREATFGERVLARIFGGFGLVALAIAASGLFGVVAFAVAQRTREIGVRRALGATDSRVVAMVAARSVWQVGLGLVLGVALGIPFAGMLAAPIAHVVQVEVASWVLVPVVLAAVAAVAIWIPARRALRVDPMAALRNE